MLKSFLLSTVMTFVTTTLTRLYKDDVYLPRPGLVKLMCRGPAT